VLSTTLGTLSAVTDNGNGTYTATLTSATTAGTATISGTLDSTTITDTETVQMTDSTAPVITGPSGGAGAVTSETTIDEGLVEVATFTASEDVAWSISGGTNGALFDIDANTGALSFRVAPVFDPNGTNTYVVEITATDDAGNASTQSLTVTVAFVPSTEISVDKSEAMASGDDKAEITTSIIDQFGNPLVGRNVVYSTDFGTLFINPEGPTVPARDNGDGTYTAFLRSSTPGLATITVTVDGRDSGFLEVNFLADPAPVITGPSGGAGAATSETTINEGLAEVATFTADENVTWSFDGGTDAGQFQIDPVTGALTFKAAPDFENPTDNDRNNTYVVRIKAVDAAGNVSLQTLTVTVGNADEIGRKLDEIGDKLRTGLRTYATQSLSDMLSFNEGLMRNANDDTCIDPSQRRDAWGSFIANERGINLDLNYSERVSQCGRPYQIFADVGLTQSRMSGNWNTRLFGALRFESQLDADTVIGLGVMGSRSDDHLLSFAQSEISDNSLQASLYARYRISDTLRTGTFIGFGRAWYDFGLTESDGFVLDGSMTGKRQLFGWMLSGDFNIADTVITTDAIVSRAVEKLGNATLSAQYLGESRSGIDFRLGTVDVTRISVPVTAPINLGGAEGFGFVSRLLLSPGLLCEDNNVDSSALNCGYQLGAKLVANDNDKGSFYADYRWESVGTMRRSLLGLGYAYRFGPKNGLELAIEANRGVTGMVGQDNRAMLSLRVAQ
jgi:hypothetical protein